MAVPALHMVLWSTIRPNRPTLLFFGYFQPPTYISVAHIHGAPANPPTGTPTTMALLTLIALFFSFDFAVIGAALLIRAFITSNNQVSDLRAAIPRGTVLDVDRHGAV